MFIKTPFFIFMNRFLWNLVYKFTLKHPSYIFKQVYSYHTWTSRSLTWRKTVKYLGKKTKIKQKSRIDFYLTRVSLRPYVSNVHIHTHTCAYTRTRTCTLYVESMVVYLMYLWSLNLSYMNIIYPSSSKTYKKP